MKKKNKTTKEKILPWEIVYGKGTSDIEGLKEAICTLGNGYLGARGARSDKKADGDHYPGTYLAGVYNILATKIAGKKIYNEDLVNCPNWTFFKLEDSETGGKSKNILSRQTLDLKKGLLVREETKKNRTVIKEERIVSMNDPHSAAIRYSVKPGKNSESIAIITGIDGAVENNGVERYSQLNSKHIKGESAGAFQKNGIYLNVKTVTSNIKITMAAKIRIFCEGKEMYLSPELVQKENNEIYLKFIIPIKNRKKIVIEKTVSIFTSKDLPAKKVFSAAIDHLKRSGRFDLIQKKHIKQWDRLWQKCDIRISEDKFSENLLRLHGFHLLQTANVHNKDLDVSIPARGLHGEAYRGHIFWDEMYVLPFFEAHLPETAEALILYRYKRLKKAREYARDNGYSGSMFPWQSGDAGTEETQVVHLNPMSGKWGPDYSRNQRHVSFAIFYNVWRHWVMTGDKKFLKKFGAELLLSIASFSASLCKYSNKDKRYHTEGLMGPDEFHEKFPGSKKAGLVDNAYSNILIVWILLKAIDLLNILPKKDRERIKRKAGIKEKDQEKWADITRKMNVIINKKGIISQFKGYFDLEELNWSKYRKKYGDIHRMDRILKSEGKSPDDYKVSKQADVLMLFYLLSLEEIKGIIDGLGYSFNEKMLARNYDYYEKRTSHGSTLSQVVHCYVSTLLGRKTKAWNWFQRVLESDIHDSQGGTTPEGIHTGVMGGSIDIVTRGFAGVNIKETRISIVPNLPKKWKKAEFNFLYRRDTIYVCVTRNTIKLKIYSKSKKEVTFEIKGQKKKLSSGRIHTFRL